MVSVSSGQKPRIVDGLPRLLALQAQAWERIVVMGCGELDAESMAVAASSGWELRPELRCTLQQ